MQRMGNIDDAVPFFGKGFNKIYPLIMVVYTLLVASNFFGRVIDFFGSWKKIKFQSEEEDMDGFNPSGMIILQKGETSIYIFDIRCFIHPCATDFLIFYLNVLVFLLCTVFLYMLLFAHWIQQAESSSKMRNFSDMYFLAFWPFRTILTTDFAWL